MANGNRKSPFDARVTNGVAIIVMGVWAVSFLADIFIKAYDPSPFVHLIAMMVAGAAVGHGFVQSGGGDK